MSLAFVGLGGGDLQREEERVEVRREENYLSTYRETVANVIQEQYGRRTSVLHVKSKKPDSHSSSGL